jgi:hypothetical protein
MINITEWKKLPRLKNEDSFHKVLKNGDLFLYGTSMIGQVEKTLKEGDKVSYFQVININGKNCEYVHVVDTLIKNKREVKDEYFRKTNG